MSHKRPSKWTEAPTPSISSNLSYSVISNEVETESPVPSNVYTPPTEKRFLKGPIPFTWLIPATRLPGKALHLGIYIWHMAGVRKSHVVGINLSLVSALFHTSRRTMHRAACALEKATLIKIRRTPGRKLSVEILGEHHGSNKSTDTTSK
jgi:hypothetical protein